MNKTNLDKSQLHGELAHISLFSAFTADQLGAILNTVVAIDLKAGEILFEHGQKAERFFFVQQGQIQLFRTSEEGDEKVIDIVPGGHLFAEAVMFMDKQRYPVNSKAIQDSRLLSISNTTFRNILEDSVDTCFRLMADMSQRLHGQVNEIYNLSLHNATYRLINHLLQTLPEELSDNTEVSLSYPKNVLASRLSIKPETFSRIMSRLKQENIIDVQGNHIVLHDINALQRFMVD